MFCPEGYVPLSKLWDEYREKRLRDFYDWAAKFYASDDFSVAFVRGSPLDICEHIFLKAVSKVGVSLAAPSGQVMKVHSPLYDGNVSLFSVLNVGASATASLMHKLEPDKAIDPRIHAGVYYLSWPGEPDEEALWRETYPVLSSSNTEQWEEIEEALRFHCLPLCFERKRFVVPKTLLPWTLDQLAMIDVKFLIQNFGGWSICMAQEDLSAWQPYLDGKGVYPDELRIGSSPRGTGRPDKQLDALRDYQKTFPEGHEDTWKKTLQQIELTTGNLYSESTLRRALQSAHKD